MGNYPSTRRFNKANELYTQFESLSDSERKDPTRKTKKLLRRAIKFYGEAMPGLRKKNGPNLGVALFRLAAIEWHVYRHGIEIETPVEVSSHRRLLDVIMLSEEASEFWKSRPESRTTVLAVILSAAYQELFMKRASVAYQELKRYKETHQSTDDTRRNRKYIETTMQMGNTYWSRHLGVGTHINDSEAIGYLEEARDLCVNDENDDIRYACWYNLALIYHHRSEKTPNIEDSTKAIDSYRGMVAIASRKKDTGYTRALEITNQSNPTLPSLTDADLYQQLTALTFDAFPHTVKTETANAPQSAAPAS